MRRPGAPRVRRRVLDKVAIWLAILAIGLASAALAESLSAPSWPLVCQETFHGQFGPQPIWYPCKAGQRP